MASHSRKRHTVPNEAELRHGAVMINPGFTETLTMMIAPSAMFSISSVEHGAWAILRWTNRTEWDFLMAKFKYTNILPVESVEIRD